MYFKEILKLAEDAAKGITNVSKGALGSNGYGFVFRDMNEVWKYTDLDHSSKFYRLGYERKLGAYALHENFSFNRPSLGFSSKDDVPLVGAIKTLVPTMFVGGADLLFEVWAFVHTPDGLRFPMNIYYGSTRLSLGGWNIQNSMAFFDDAKDHCEELRKITNFSPFDLDKQQKEELAEALELGLRHVPVSDFYGIFYPREEYKFMAIKGSDIGLFKFDEGFFTAHIGLDFFLNKRFKFNIDTIKFIKDFKQQLLES